MIGFDGGMNTGLTLRTAHIRDGVAAVRTGATLLFDSDPAAEERETQLKARALLETLAEAGPRAAAARAGGGAAGGPAAAAGAGLRVLLVDHQDSFVHTLAGYLRELGAAGDHAAGRLRPGAAGRLRPRPGRAVARAGPARRLRLRQAARRPGRARPAGLRRVPGPAGDGRARAAGRCGAAGHAGARQAGPGAGARRVAAGRAARRVHRRAGITRCTPGPSRSAAGSRSPR